MIEWKINNYPTYKHCNLSTPVSTMTKSSVPSSQQESITYTHSLNLDDTSKGLRISVHVYTIDHEKAIEEAFKMYIKAKITAIDNKIPLAPVEIK